MPFRVKSGKDSFGKLVQIGREFPLKIGDVVIAILAIDKDKPNQLHVTNLVKNALSLQSGLGFRNSSNEEFTNFGSDFIVFHLKTKCAFIIVFEEDPIRLE